MTLSRRDFLHTASGAALAAGLSMFPRGWHARAADGKRKRLLVYTRSAGFQHPVVQVKDGKPCLVDRVWTELAAKHGFDVECTKDGRIFLPETLAKFDALFFYTTGDLTSERSADGSPPMPKDGKQALLDAIAAGKGFLGSHCASDTFHSRGGAFATQDKDTMDPYIAMVGGEFIRHGEQQESTMRVVDPAFPGLKGVSDFRMHEEWYSLKNFAPDLRVILAQDTKGMRGSDYERPNFPATWARAHGKGRVFYTSMGHREDVWANPLFTNLLLGALSWATGQVEADLTPNLQAATPQAATMPKPPPPRDPSKGKAKAKAQDK